MFQPLTLRSKQLDQLDLSARTAGVAHWRILSSPDAVVSASHRSRCGIAALGGTTTLRGVGYAPARRVMASGFDWLGCPCGWHRAGRAPQRTASPSEAKNNLHVLSLWL